MKTLRSSLFVSILSLSMAASVFAGEFPPPTDVAPPTSADTRYGPFNLLDNRTNYGSGIFPEPFLVDDSDLEPGELRFDWFHSAGEGATHTDAFLAEIEKSIGVVTFELEVPFERDVTPGQPRVLASDNINPGVRAPIYQYISPSGFINTTFGAGFESGIPTHSSISKNMELVPKVFNDIAIGKHITLQSIFGYSMVRGPKSLDGGLNTFEYGFVLGYTIFHDELPIPGVEQIIPVFELQGEKAFDKGEETSNSLFGNAAIRINTKAIGSIQPRPGLGFIFPMTNAARADAHWGIYSSMVFEF